MALFPRAFLVSALCLLAACAPADEIGLEGNWALNPDQASLQFITIKAGDIVEAHHFGEMSGTVSAEGEAEIQIALDSVQTNIDIRDERMREFLFETDAYPAATVSAALDPASFSSLAIGETLITPVELTLDLHGASQIIETELAVTRTDAKKVLVTSRKPILIDAGDYELSAGLEQLRELANLPSITPTVSVTFSLVFER